MSRPQAPDQTQARHPRPPGKHVESRLRGANARIRHLEASIRNPDHHHEHANAGSPSRGAQAGPEPACTPRTNATSARSQGQSNDGSRLAAGANPDSEG
ncbi:hypothetical protein INS49_004495 [Diaporthe citri]|uniref:uncharacterized protein n=1 Tax=Diaporthe citri TaxID=83186 RepID=UPI001C7ECF5A|nr:uncharacterized protein INS49_004495 [Diaporthe citri]KAG6354478.1 hypothetical protein INS49_004495 [Diaporthe citri]